MKSYILGMIVFFANTAVYANNSYADGFRDIKWKAPISKYKDVMNLTSDDTKPVKYYKKNEDDMFLGKIKLDSLVYVFYKGMFASVVMQTERSSLNSSQLLSEFNKKFGKPAYSNKYTKKFKWESKSTDVALKCYSSSHKCSVIFESVEVNKIKAIEKNK